MISTSVNSTFTRLKDGSVSYGVDHRNLTPAQIEAKAKEYAIPNNIYSVENFTDLSPQSIHLLESLIEKMESKNIKISFFLSPYNPYVYHIFETNSQYREIKQSEVYYKDLALKHQIPVMGSFDPQACGMDETFFYDGMHCNSTGIKKLLSTYPND